MANFYPNKKITDHNVIKLDPQEEPSIPIGDLQITWGRNTLRFLRGNSTYHGNDVALGSG